jgi:molybdenum cofactor cytidylyltransferase
VTGVVLAAGQSRRMGQPKALLPARAGDTFLSAQIRTLTAGGTDDVIVVTRPGDAAIDAELARFGPAARLRRIENVAADEGAQLSSILVALAAVGDRSHAILVVPVDMPLIAASTVRRLVETFRASRAPILRAVHAGRHGHPVLFSRDVFEDLRRADPSVGARAVVRARGAMDVEVDDPGVLEDVDTPEDYRRLFGSPPPD